jgi:hypothetical protein
MSDRVALARAIAALRASYPTQKGAGSIHHQVSVTTGPSG